MKRPVLLLAVLSILLCGCAGLKTETPVETAPTATAEATTPTAGPETPAPVESQTPGEPTPEPSGEEEGYDWELAQYDGEDLWVTEYTCEREEGTVILAAVTNPTDETLSVYGCLTVLDASGEVYRTVEAQGGVIAKGESALLLFEAGELPENAATGIRYAGRAEEGLVSVVNEVKCETEETEDGLTLTCTCEGAAEVREYICYFLFWNNEEEVSEYVPVVIATPEDPLLPGESLSVTVAFPDEWMAYSLYSAGVGLPAEP